ncbi:MAG: hypothetical protein HYX79_09970 [Chloroflexi bacterium]|nr:hypothetical protein [Chloroflexota bacterium]
MKKVHWLISLLLVSIIVLAGCSSFDDIDKTASEGARPGPTTASRTPEAVPPITTPGRPPPPVAAPAPVPAPPPPVAKTPAPSAVPAPAAAPTATRAEAKTQYLKGKIFIKPTATPAEKERLHGTNAVNVVLTIRDSSTKAVVASARTVADRAGNFNAELKGVFPLSRTVLEIDLDTPLGRSKWSFLHDDFIPGLPKLSPLTHIL